MDGVRDVVIVGAGPAGIYAAIHLHRAGFEPLLLEEDAPGGLVRRAHIIENYPGFPNGIAADELIELFCEQLKASGGTVSKTKVEHVSGSHGTFSIKTSSGEFRSKAVIVATGTKPNGPVFEGSRDLEDRRIFYDLLELLAVKNSNDSIVVYGGGDAAFDQGLNLRCRGHDVIILCRSRAHCLSLLRKRADTWNIQVM